MLDIVGNRLAAVGEEAADEPRNAFGRRRVARRVLVAGARNSTSAELTLRRGLKASGAMRKSVRTVAACCATTLRKL